MDAAPPDDHPFRATVEVVQSTYDYMPAALAGYLAGVGVVAMLYASMAPWGLLLPWAGAFVLMCLVRGWVIARFRRAAPSTPAQWAVWQRRSSVGTVVAAAMWGATGWIFYGLGQDTQQATGLIVIIYTFTVAGIPVLATQPRLYLAYAVLCLMPLVVRIAMGGDLHSYQLAGELILIISTTAVLANSYRQALRRAIELKVQGDELAAQLRVETLAAEAARREAEVANMAKTRFFTAASHDLRQPLHAMGLFAEALRQRVHEPEVAHLVNSINESVDALEGLFSELLDITRLDSGVIEVHPQHFEIGDIMRKIRLHFEPSAFEKGLELRMRGSARSVFADPLLVERVLRNLVANAIRYTEDGTVLVSCRARGKRMLLQVWDTGPGIADQHRRHIFDEYYQIPDGGERSPEQRKGLGLGLAIVKRLAGLMQAPLDLASVPGRGTVFTMELPAGRPSRDASRLVAPAKGPLALTLEGRRIVVVEDEPAVRAGLQVLLEGWRATIHSFESVAATAQWAAGCDPVAERPDLLIVDYRLEEGRTGVDAITVLRQRFGHAVPAILVTGSTMTGHEKEASERDFHVLIKPVVPNKLRAMIAFKLGMR